MKANQELIAEMVSALLPLAVMRAEPSDISKGTADENHSYEWVSHSDIRRARAVIAKVMGAAS